MPGPTSIIANDHVFQGNCAFTGTASFPNATITNANVKSAADVDYSKLQHLHLFRYAQMTRPTVQRAKSRVFNIDNGAATTIDDTVLVPKRPITIRNAHIIYTTETAGTVAGANAKIGVTIGGAEIVAATAYANGATVGAKTAMTLVDPAVAIDEPVLVRHTGIAATAAGEAYVEIEYTEDDAEDNRAHDATVPLAIAMGATGTLFAIEAFVETPPTTSRTVTIDLQKGDEDTGFVSVLSAAIEIDATVAAREIVVGSIADNAIVAGDLLRLVIAIGGAAGEHACGLNVTVRAMEKPV